MLTTDETAVRELDRRTQDHFDVRLLWNPQTDEVLLAVEDEGLEMAFELPVDPSRALEAFHHPFAYAGGPEPGLPAPGA